MIRLSVAENGIHGFYNKTRKPFDTMKAVIVLGGSEGSEVIPMMVSKLFSEHGITALGINYWNVAGTRGELINIPVETIEKAAKWLTDEGYTKIAIYGFSKGAELALLSASLLPQIHCVIAVSPTFCVWAGLAGGSSILNKKMSLTQSSFQFRGVPLPFVYGEKKARGVIKRLLTQRQLNMSFIYEKALIRNQLIEDAEIQVEKINGSILLLSPEKDAMWPSKYSGERIMKRLKAEGFGYPAKHEIYTCSHFLAPVAPSPVNIFRIERTQRDLCRESRVKAFKQSLQWLHEF